MRALPAACFLLLSCATEPVGTANRSEGETLRAGLTVRPVARDAWVFTHDELHASNVLSVKLSEGTVVLCSSPFDTGTTRALLGWVRARLSPSRIIAINTHWHLDGTGGNAAYHEEGVETWASVQTRALQLERGERLRADAAEGLPAALADAVLGTPIVGAEFTFEESAGLALVLGGERVEVTYPGAAHSQDNVVVWFPDRKLLFGGCMLKVGDTLGYLGDASLETWGAALGHLELLGAEVVVPGHGPTGGPEIIANTQQLVRAARSR